MAAVGCVYTVDPKVRTAEDVVAALFREHSPRRDDDPEPVAQQKRIWSSLSHERDGRFCQAEEEVFSWMADEVGLRRRRGQKIVCVMDGQPSLWAVRKTYLPGENVVEILDLLHATPRLWEAAYLFHREFACDSLRWYWNRILGQRCYPDATSILLLCDRGGSNSASSTFSSGTCKTSLTTWESKSERRTTRATARSLTPSNAASFLMIARACQGMLFDTLDTVVRRRPQSLDDHRPANHRQRLPPRLRNRPQGRQ